jgi:hypothetical protein
MWTCQNIKNDLPKAMFLPKDPNLDLINQVYIKKFTTFLHLRTFSNIFILTCDSRLLNLMMDHSEVMKVRFCWCLLLEN